MIIGIILLSIVSNLRSLTNHFISDDITALSDFQKRGFKLNFKEWYRIPYQAINDLCWCVFKDREILHHLFSLLIYIALNLSFFAVGSRFLGKDIAFVSTIIFLVHPCNAQATAWISGKWYALGGIVALWAIYFNSGLLTLIVPFLSVAFAPLPLMLKIPLWEKIVLIALSLYLMTKPFEYKFTLVDQEGHFKKENKQLYPRKIIVALKSFCYYFCLAVLPIKLGWFHEIGEPIDKKLKSFDFHAMLCVLLIGSLCLFIGSKCFIGLLLFALFILPFSNIITVALFTSERYMLPALMGFSIFMAYLLQPYPIVATIFITYYFTRRQLELWGYQDDMHLALYSLLNFPKSGFAWNNLSNIFLKIGKPGAAYDLLVDAEKALPNFPTTFYQLYLINRANDLLGNHEKALQYLEKAIARTPHESWMKELEDYRIKLKQARIQIYRNKNVNRRCLHTNRPNTQLATKEISEDVLAVVA